MSLLLQSCINAGSTPCTTRHNAAPGRSHGCQLLPTNVSPALACPAEPNASIQGWCRALTIRQVPALSLALASYFATVAAEAMPLAQLLVRAGVPHSSLHQLLAGCAEGCGRLWVLPCQLRQSLQPLLC